MGAPLLPQDPPSISERSWANFQPWPMAVLICRAVLAIIRRRTKLDSGVRMSQSTRILQAISDQKVIKRLEVLSEMCGSGLLVAMSIVVVYLYRNGARRL
ncbi:hypothetical protein BDR06DRAFT_958406 [Suillus hirtellus]|nr:hypothetical protein BDR06DRAFT_958406 [Suillus hirtellus]